MKMLLPLGWFAEVNPFTVFRIMPPGSAIYSREQIDAGAWEIAWLIREETVRIQALGESPEIEFRTTLVWVNAVALIPVLLRVGPLTNKSVYETWVNVHAPGQANPMDDLAIQPRLVVQLYGDGCELMRSVTVSNQLQAFARRVLSVWLPTMRPWSMAAFDAAREQYYASHPTVMSVWEAL